MLLPVSNQQRPFFANVRLLYSNPTSLVRFREVGGATPHRERKSTGRLLPLSRPRPASHSQRLFPDNAPQPSPIPWALIRPKGQRTSLLIVTLVLALLLLPPQKTMLAQQHQAIAIGLTCQALDSRPIPPQSQMFVCQKYSRWKP